MSPERVARDVSRDIELTEDRELFHVLRRYDHGNIVLQIFLKVSSRHRDPLVDRVQGIFSTREVR
jgi:hypothetical protein